MSTFTLDHFVLTVRNIQKTLTFYQNILGITPIYFGHNRVALKLGNQKINLHEVNTIASPKAKNPSIGAGDLCLITEIPLEEWVTKLKAKQVLILDGPVQRTGTKGAILSLYINDPDGNLIEISNQL